MTSLFDLKDERMMKVRKRIVEMREQEKGWTEIRDEVLKDFGVGVHRSTIQRWHDSTGYLQKSADIDPSTAKDVSEDVVQDLKTYKLKAERDNYKAKYETLMGKQASSEVFTQVFHDAIKLAVSLPPVEASVYNPPPSGVHRGETPQSVVAPLTDTHVGDRVDINQTYGLSQYDIELFNKRLYGWTYQVINLSNLRRNIAPIKELVIPMLGDMISGDIHEELARTNVENCMMQMMNGAYLIAQSIRELSSHFPQIRVPAVVGNHGRMTRKIPSKEKYMDWDYMMYQWVAAFCRDLTNVSFEIPKSFMHIFEVANQRVLIMHGDSVAGGGGLNSITSAITKLRSVVQYGDRLVEGDTRFTGFDAVMIGHFHRIDEYDIGTGPLLINGTLKGGDEYTTSRLHVATAPKHLISYWHPDIGYLGKEIIYLDKYDDQDVGFHDVIPEIWAS
mgnify:FL=1